MLANIVARCRPSIAAVRQAACAAPRSATPRQLPQPWLLRQLSLLSFFSPRSIDDKPGDAPSPPARPHSRQRYGVTWQDEYSWIEQESLESLPHYRHEQQYLLQYLKGPHGLYSSLLHELRALETAARAPTLQERCGPFLYQSLPPVGAATNATLLRQCLETGAQQLLLDDTLVAADLAAAWPHLPAVGDSDMVVADIQLSKDQQWLAYTVGHHAGADVQTLIVRDLAAGQVVKSSCREVVMGVLWDSAGHLLHTLPDSRGRPFQVVRHALGAPLPDDVVVVEEPSEAHFVGLGRTKDWTYVTVNINSKTDSEVYLLKGGGGAPVCVQSRQEGLEYFVEHHHGWLYLLTNMGKAGADYSLAACPAPRADAGVFGLAGWRVVVPERGDASVTDIDMFDGGCVLYEQQGCGPGATVLPLRRGAPPDAAAASESLQQVPLPAWATHVSGGANQDFCSSTLRISCSSPIHPEATFDFHFESQKLELLGTQPAPAGHDPDAYACEVIHAAADDGVQVPITVVAQRGTLALPQRQCPSEAHNTHLHHPGAAGLGAAAATAAAAAAAAAVAPARAAAAAAAVGPAAEQPLVLQGYGAYGLPQDMAFEAHRLALLSRGWKWAWAHGRGGGELGRRWHEAGRGARKPVAVSDFLACLEHLLASGYVREGRVAGSCFSAGGVLLGAALNRRPAAFGAAVLRAPFVDLLTVMTDPEQPLTVHEYDEWGGVDSVGSVRQLQDLCPYQNLKPQEYPPTLITTAFDDTRVPWWGPVKYAARLRACQEGAAPVLLAMEEEGGHFAAAGHVQQLALEYTFLLAAMQSKAPA